MRLIWHDGHLDERPLMAKLVGAKRGNRRPEAVAFDAQELCEIAARLAEPDFRRWYFKVLTTALAPRTKGPVPT